MLITPATPQEEANLRQRLNAFARSGPWQIAVECRVCDADIRWLNSLDWSVDDGRTSCQRFDNPSRFMDLHAKRMGWSLNAEPFPSISYAVPGNADNVATTPIRAITVSERLLQQGIRMGTQPFMSRRMKTPWGRGKLGAIQPCVSPATLDPPAVLVTCPPSDACRLSDVSHTRRLPVCPHENTASLAKLGVSPRRPKKTPEELECPQENWCSWPALSGSPLGEIEVAAVHWYQLAARLMACKHRRIGMRQSMQPGSYRPGGWRLRVESTIDDDQVAGHHLVSYPHHGRLVIPWNQRGSESKLFG